MIQCAYCGKELQELEGTESCKAGRTGEPCCKGCCEDE